MIVNKSYSELIGVLGSFKAYQNGLITLGQEKNERYFWATIIEEDNPESYNRYLDKYPNGYYVKEAKIKIDKFIRIDKKRLLKEQRLRDVAKAKEAQKEKELKIEADENSWEEAKKLNNKDSYRHYLKYYPTGIHIKEAEDKFNEFQKKYNKKGNQSAILVLLGIGIYIFASFYEYGFLKGIGFILGHAFILWVLLLFGLMDSCDTERRNTVIALWVILLLDMLIIENFISIISIIIFGILISFSIINVTNHPI